MTGITEWSVVGVIVVLMGMAGTIVTWTNSSNKKWDEVNRNLIKNTETLESLQKYLNRVEADLNKRLDRQDKRIDKQEERLDQHRERIIKLETQAHRKEEEE